MEDNPRTISAFPIYCKDVDNTLGTEPVFIDWYEQFYDPRREVWQSGNQTVPSTQPEWAWYLESLNDDAVENDIYKGPVVDEWDYAVAINLPPGGCFHDEVFYLREYGGYQKWQWSGSGQSTIRRPYRWWETYTYRDYRLHVPEGGGGGGGS